MDVQFPPVILVCYRPDQYLRILETVEDAGKLEQTWKLWKTSLEQTKSKFTLQGLECIEVTIDMDDFEAFSQQRNIPNNTTSHYLYAAEMFLQSRRDTEKSFS
jgi:hypothetical protein